MNMKVLVTGATGAQGGAVVRHLVNNGIKVKALLTKTDNDEWFKANEIETVVGDFLNKESLANAMVDVTNVSLVYPLIYEWDTLRAYTDNLIYAFSQANLESIVFNTSLPMPPQKTGSVAADIKLEMYEKFTAANIPLITIMPSFYLDNLTAPWSLPVIKENLIIGYPLPADAQFAWLSHYNLAQYTYKALLKKELIGKIFPIGGELMSGNEIATKVSTILGKQVTYVYQKPDQFKQFLLQMYNEEIAGEIAGIYGNIALNTEPFKAFYNRTVVENIFDIKLQTFDEWAETINWK
ncbi:MAG: NmrA family NAD(P)-binding protein [Chitinophagaceae bacterium]|nr:NmrA family NAD(P)-binding protein [Chitinophagaceae bacterium]